MEIQCSIPSCWPDDASLHVATAPERYYNRGNAAFRYVCTLIGMKTLIVTTCGTCFSSMHHSSHAVRPIVSLSPFRSTFRSQHHRQRISRKKKKTTFDISKTTLQLVSDPAGRRDDLITISDAIAETSWTDRNGNSETGRNLRRDYFNSHPCLTSALPTARQTLSSLSDRSCTQSSSPSLVSRHSYIPTE